LKARALLRIARSLYRRYIEDEVPALSAQTAYFFLLAVFPFMIFLMTIIGYIPLEDIDVLGPLENMLPYEAFRLLKVNLEYVADKRNFQILSIGFVTTLWAASNGIGAVIVSINKAYDVKEKRSFFMVKLVSLLFTMALSAMIVLYFVLLVFGHRIGDYMISVGVPAQYRKVWDQLRYLTVVIMQILVFAALYKYTPCSRPKWRDVLPGAVFTTVGWLLTSLGFAYYVNNFWNLRLLYGSIGGLIALLVWLYLSAMLVILGGEINAVIASERHSGIKSCR